MDLRCSTERWTAVACLAVCMACTGCSQAVMLTQETEHGGVVTYLYKEDRGGPMGSPHRREAVAVMEKKCRSGYTVIKEGEVRGYASMSSVEGAEGEVTGRRWGLQFRCKHVG